MQLLDKYVQPLIYSVMKDSVLRVVTMLIVLALSACTPVKFYSDAGLTKNTGIKYYTVKPYLQVEKDPLNNNILKAAVIYLPDLENPQYMVLKDGLGSRKMDLKLTEGSINTLGIATDPKIAESIEAMAALIAKSAAAIEDLSGLKGFPPAAGSSITELYEITMADGITAVRKIDIR